MKVIHQPTKYSCVACVVAMITDDSLEEVFDAIGHNGAERHFRFLDCAAFLNRRGYHLGLCGFGPGMEFIDVFQPALVIVACSVGKGNHAVYWNGYSVLDPEPANKGKQLADYTVREWWPVTKYEE